MKRRALFIVIISIWAAIAVLFIAKHIWDSFEGKAYPANNLFAYLIDLNDQDYTFSSRGLKYGMSANELLREEGLTEEHLYDWYIMSEELVEKVPYGTEGACIESVRVVNRFSYDTEGFWGRSICLYMDPVYEEDMRELLYEQAKAYMPELTGIMTNNPDPVYGYKPCLEQIKTQSTVYWVDVPSNISISKDLDTEITTIEIENTIARPLEKVLHHTRVDLKIDKKEHGLLEIKLSCGYHPEF